MKKFFCLCKKAVLIGIKTMIVLLALGVMYQKVDIAFGAGLGTENNDAFTDVGTFRAVLCYDGCKNDFNGERMNRPTDYAVLDTDMDFVYEDGAHRVSSSGEGWDYDRATHTLTLNNFHGQRIEVQNMLSDTNDFTINLVGENVLENNTDMRAIIVGCSSTGKLNLYIKGPGSLTIKQTSKSGVEALYCEDVVLSDQGIINITYKSNEDYAKAATIANLTVDKDCTLTSKATKGLFYIGVEANIKGTLTTSVSKKSHYGWEALWAYKIKVGSGNAFYAGKNAAKAVKKSSKVYSVTMFESEFPYVSIEPKKK